MNRFATATLAMLLACTTGFTIADAAEKRVTIYTSYGIPGESNWRLPLRIWVHEEPDLARELLAKAVRDELAERAGIGELTQAQKDLFMVRAEGFIADSESRETVRLQFAEDSDNQSYLLRTADGDVTTDRNGLVEGFISIPNEQATRLLAATDSQDGWLTLRAVSEDHAGTGRVRLIRASGLSVISDVDDTVKVTNIPSGEAEVLKNTFFRSFSAAPCMADLYRSFATDVSFHYVSGGPWQMYQPLADFLFAEPTGFPEGSFHMKNVRTNPFESESYQDVWQLISSGSQQATFEQKVLQIGTLIEQFPGRQFVLIGDSGERDPEVFAEIRERFATQVVEIRIRDVVNDAAVRPERLQGMRIIPAVIGAQFDCRTLQSIGAL